MVLKWYICLFDRIFINNTEQCNFVYTHTNRRHDRTRFDRAMVYRVSQNALKRSQRPP